MTVPPIEAVNLSKRFGTLIALDDVSFEVSKPCVIGLVGPNGSGKSTLLRLLMGSMKPSSGEARLFTRSPRESRTMHTDIGYLSAADRLFPELTVLENMIYRGRFYGLDKKQGASMATRLLRERSLYALRDRNPETLSTGQRRQISLLSTLMHQPKILLLDEPTTGIDMLAINDIYRLMSELCEDSCTIVLATHHLEELVTLCQHTIALHDGQLVYDGLTSRLGSNREAVRGSLQRFFTGKGIVPPSSQPALSDSLEQVPTLSERPSIVSTTGAK